jgi:hypothetical protein
MAQNPSYEDIRSLINEVMNTDTSDVETPSKPKAKGAKMAEPMMKEDGPKAEMPAVEEQGAENAAADAAAKPAAKPMTAAELAEKVGMEEKELMDFLEKSGLLESAGGMEGLLAALAANPAMVDELANLVKTTQGAGSANTVPMV